MCEEWGGGKGQIENVDMVVMSNEELVWEEEIVFHLPGHSTFH